MDGSGEKKILVAAWTDLEEKRLKHAAVKRIEGWKNYKLQKKEILRQR